MRWLILIFGLLFSFVLLSLGVPRVVASVLKAPAFVTLLAAHGGEPQPSEQLGRAAGYLEAAARWESSGRIRTDLGFLLLLQSAQSDPEDPKRVELARQAAEALREGLLRGPAGPHSWIRLAYARMIETGPSPEVAALLEQSLEAGGFVGEITVSRLELLLRNWDHLPPDARTLTGKQLRFAWKRDRRRLIEIAKQTNRAHIIRFAIRSMPGALDQFDAALAKSER